MENTVAETAAEPPRRRRRSGKKSKKETYQQRKRLKNIGFWLLTGGIGVAIVTAIAIMAGGASNP